MIKHKSKRKNFLTQSTIKEDSKTQTNTVDPLDKMSIQDQMNRVHNRTLFNRKGVSKFDYTENPTVDMTRPDIAFQLKETIKTFIKSEDMMAMLKADFLKLGPMSSETNESKEFRSQMKDVLRNYLKIFGNSKCEKNISMCEFWANDYYKYILNMTQMMKIVKQLKKYDIHEKEVPENNKEILKFASRIIEKEQENILTSHVQEKILSEFLEKSNIKDGQISIENMLNY